MLYLHDDECRQNLVSTGFLIYELRRQTIGLVRYCASLPSYAWMRKCSGQYIPDKIHDETFMEEAVLYTLLETIFTETYRAVSFLLYLILRH